MQHGRMYLLAAIILAVVATAEQAQSQSWPQKPVTMVVPFGPGGNPQRLSRAFGQEFIVENRQGAGSVAASAGVQVK